MDLPEEESDGLSRPKDGRFVQSRIILHLDYDYFYGAVFEKQQPTLKGLPLGVQQKSILATCNYEARRLGVKKLMLISEAKKICPNLVLVNGEDLSPFRDVSKRLYNLARSYSWNQRVERLGLDEIFFDATDIVNYNVGLLNPHAPATSFFSLSSTDPEVGFEYDARDFVGCVWRASPEETSPDQPTLMRLLVATHLAKYLRNKVEEAGYTSVCGISTNKTLSKLVGSKNKPRNQTVLLASSEESIQAFMDPHLVRKVPGIGARTSAVLESHVSHRPELQAPLTVGQILSLPVSPHLLEQWLGSRAGALVWNLLHGADDSEVKPASGIPTQISIEDTYQGLNDTSEIDRELHLLSAHLLERMKLDLVDGDRWLAHPRTLRLTTRPKTSAAEDKPYNYNRRSKSQPLPNFVFSLSSPPDDVVDRLVQQCLLPMFAQLHPSKDGLRIGLLNVCVASMVLSGTEDGTGVGRDISSMFRNQKDALREWTVYDNGPPSEVDEQEKQQQQQIIPSPPFEAEPAKDVEEDDLSLEYAWEDDLGLLERDEPTERCATCGHLFPQFAAAAHHQYHALEAD